MYNGELNDLHWNQLHATKVAAKHRHSMDWHIALEKVNMQWSPVRTQHSGLVVENLPDEFAK